MKVIHAESHGDWAARGWPAANIAARGKSIFNEDRERDLDINISTLLNTVSGKGTRLVIYILLSIVRKVSGQI
jgi:hypothetical protein